MVESQIKDKPLSWHWSDVSEEANMKKALSLKRIRNKPKDAQKYVYRKKY